MPLALPGDGTHLLVQVGQAVAQAQSLLPLLLPVANPCLADRHWAAIFAILPVRPAGWEPESLPAAAAAAAEIGQRLVASSLHVSHASHARLLSG